MNALLRRNFNFTLLILAGLLLPQLSFSQGGPASLVRMVHESTSPPDNEGTIPIIFTKSANVPVATSNAAPDTSGETAYDFGTTPGNYYVQSTEVLDGLKNLSAFTLTGWLNAKSLTTGSGGNRIISWINAGGDGVDLVVQSNGSLRLGVDGWPDYSPAFSSANKVTANATAPLQNWVFFAVTYQSNGQVSFYFGNYTDHATLDVSRTYTAPGVTGSNIGKLAIGAFNDASRSSVTWDRMFRGIVDDIRVYGSVLNLTDITAVQRSDPDMTPPTPPTNLRTSFVDARTIGLTWDAGTDYIGVVGYEIYDGGSLMASVGNVTNYTLTALQSERTYNLTVKSKDAAGNLSPSSTSLSVLTTDTQAGVPLLYLTMDGIAGGTVSTYGTVQGQTFTTGTGPSNTYLPGSSLETPPYVGGNASADFGVTPGNAFIESQTPIDQLKNMSSFTITGWVNCKSNVAGAGGNRIVSWINNGGDGVDLVYQSNGSLRLGVDGWPDNSPAFSNANKVTTNASAPQSNWVFFAVTYQSNGEVQYYFGTNTAKAILDVTKTYSGPGVTGSNIGKFSIGAFNSATRNSSTYDRMFRGLIDDIRVFGSVLPLSEIIAVQGKNSTDVTPPTAPSNLMATSKSVSTISLSWTPATDNIAVDGYKLYNNGNIVANISSVTNFIYTGLTPGTNYNLTLKAVDPSGNQSVASNAISVTTDATGVPLPLIDAKFEESAGGYCENEGTASAGFTRSNTVPAASTIVPNVPNDLRSADFGTTPGNYYISNANPDYRIEELKNLGSFTLTGWLNNRSNTTGTGGNKIITWTNNGGDGVDLVYQSDGSLRLGVDEFAGASPAVSSTNKVTTDANAGATNWVFFAVTYQSANDQVQFYFGDNTTDAVLDVTKNYPGRGATGLDIGQLAFGAFNDASRTEATFANMFRGIIDNFKIYGSSLSLADIRSVQHGVSSDVIPPSAPTALTATDNQGTSIRLTWIASTDNVGVVDYNIYNGATLLETTQGPYNNTKIVYGLTPGQSYQISLKARDAAGNLSAASNVVNIRVPLMPLIHIPFSTDIASRHYNIGSLGGLFVGGPVTYNTPIGGSLAALTTSVRTIETDYVYEGLKNLSAFTVTGWVNRTSSSNAERIFGWMPTGGGDGVDLLIQVDGSLRLGVDGLAENSPAFSNANKITTDASASENNWTFFAVTYQANGQTQFYFGNNSVNASLDATVNYPNAGSTGTNIATPYIKAPTGGILDEPRVYNSVLTLQDILAIQYGPEDTIPPTSPGVLTSPGVTATSIALHWSQVSTDNIAVTSYDVFNGNTMIRRHVPDGRYSQYQDMAVFALTPNTTYNLYVKARDNRGNYSAPTNTVTVTTLIDSPAPLVWLKLDEDTGQAGAGNSGSSNASFTRSSGIPTGSDNVPTGIGSVKSADFGTTSANAYVESTTTISALANLSGFTITGWVNNKSSVMGSGGNRIVSWVNNGGDGVDLVYKNNGSLQLGVDQWPDFSPAISSANKVPTNASAPASNWVFFAVTYTESGAVEFYFGSNTVQAALDVTKTYTGRGATGANIGKMAVGHFNDATRNANTDRIFRGLIDDIRVYGAKLTPQQIVQVQGMTGNSGGRIAVSPEQTIVDEFIDEAALSQNYPNPFNEITNVEVNIPHSVKVARLNVYDLTGRSLQNIVVEGRGPTSISVSRGDMHAGVYIYTLITDGKIVGHKRMMIK